MLHPLKLNRLEKGLTQYDLSLLSGIPQVRLSYAERGYPVLNPKQKEVLSRFFNSTLSELFPNDFKK